MENFWKFLPNLVRKATMLGVFLTLSKSAIAQSASRNADSLFIRNIFTHALTQGKSYAWLEHLTKQIGHRLSGSASAAKAENWTFSVLDSLGLDQTRKLPCMVPHWVRGKAEKVKVLSKGGVKGFDLHALALGGSVATPKSGLQAEIVRVQQWEELDKLGEKGIQGKIVYYSRAMDQSKLRTFDAYGGAVDQRVFGASRAAKYGALGVIVRSVGTRIDDFPHTGTLLYDSTYALIPAAAISTRDAEKLNALLQQGHKVQVSMEMYCETLPDVPANSIIAEIKGSEFPNEVVLVGGHLDSWDVGEGAHDDGAGVVQSMEVLRILHQLGYKPRHTIRCVLFMNEENGGRGGASYYQHVREKKEFPLASIESDAGGFTPRGFTFEGDASVFGPFYEKVSSYQALLEPYGLKFSKGGSGADIGPLRPLKGLLVGYSPDSQRYFDLHHTAADVLETVNARELELGAASMAALVYLLDLYGL